MYICIYAVGKTIPGRSRMVVRMFSPCVKNTDRTAAAAAAGGGGSVAGASAFANTPRGTQT